MLTIQYQILISQDALLFIVYNYGINNIDLLPALQLFLVVLMHCIYMFLAYFPLVIRIMDLPRWVILD